MSRILDSKVARDVHEWMEVHGAPTAEDRFRKNVVYLRMNVRNTHSYVGETANWTQRVPEASTTQSAHGPHTFPFWQVMEHSIDTAAIALGPANAKIIATSPELKYNMMCAEIFTRDGRLMIQSVEGAVHRALYGLNQRVLLDTQRLYDTRTGFPSSEHNT